MSEEEGTILLSSHKTSSSLLQINETHVNALPSGAVVSKETVSIVPLDSFIGNVIDPKNRVYLKIDVQGYEMFVLRGASLLLDQVRVIEIELSFLPLYEDSPVFTEMVPYLEQLGFALVALDHVFSDPRTDRLLQVDGIFKKVQ